MLLAISTIILLGTGLVFSLRFAPVQSYFGRLAADFLSRELGAEISVERLYFDPFSSLQIRELYISDQRGDTLLHAPRMKASLDLTRFFQGQMTINDVDLRDALFRLHIDSQGESNLSFLIDYFRPAQPDSLRKRKITIDLQLATLEQVSFIYINEAAAAGLTGTEGRTIDFNDIHASRINGRFSAIDFRQHLASARIEGFSLIEKSGFEIRQLNTHAIIDPHQIELRGLDLRTNQSSIRDYLLLSFEDYGDFDDFINRVDLRLELDQSHISSKDIAYFAPDMEHVLFDIDLSGSLYGRVNAVEGRRIDLRASTNTRLQGDLSIHGLPDIEHTEFDVRLQHFSTNDEEIERLVYELGRQRRIELPEHFGQLGSLQYSGDFEGRYNDFRAAGSLRTELGKLDTDIHIDFREGTTLYSGSLYTSEFDIGQFLSLKHFGKTGFLVSIDGKNFDPRTIDLRWDGQVGHVDLLDYRYQQIETSGILRDQQVQGTLAVNDPNLRMDARGQVGLDPLAPYYQLDANLNHADLGILGFYPESQAILRGAQVHADLLGTTLNDLRGDLSILDLQVDLHQDRYHVQSLALTANGLHDERRISIESDLLTASVSGRIDFYSLRPYYESLAGLYIPSLDLVSEVGGDQDFEFDLEILDFAPLAAFFVPELAIAPGTTLSGHFRSDDRGVFPGSVEPLSIVELFLPQAGWGSAIFAEAIDLQIRADSAALTSNLRTGSIRVNHLQPFDSLHFSQRLREDRAVYEIHLGDATDLHDAQLSGTVLFSSDRTVAIHSHPSDIRLNGAEWQMSKAQLQFREGKTSIRGLDFHNREQRIRIDGIVSKDAEDQLHLLFDNFDLATINPFLTNVTYRFGGKVNGKADINAILHNPYAAADLSIERVTMDQLPLGDLRINADFDQDKSLVNLALGLSKDDKHTLTIDGQYHINRPGDNLDLSAKFDRLELDVLQVILKDLISDVSGTLSGRAKISGSLQQALFNGTGTVDRAGFTVRYLNTPYHIDGPLRIENTKLVFEQLALADQRNQRAMINGSIDLTNPTNPAIGITIDATNLMVLNTTFQHNPLYFGTAYGTGRFRFLGTADAMNIVIDARTEENTIFHIPLNTSTVLGDSEFIRFMSFAPQDGVKPDSAAPASGLLSGLNMNMDLHVTPGTVANIHTDLGELSGRGEGQINLRISSLGDFEMFGDYQVNTGKFTFTAQDFINKIFEIKQGGTIRWTGKPVDASIALTAFYEQRTSLSPLYDAAGRTPNEQRVLTRAEMELSGNLLRPTINFGLDFPADPYVKDELQSYLSDANNVNQQALSLIVRRSFLPGSTSDFSRELNSTLLSAGTELAFNQLNNLISQSLNLNFIDLNIRSLNDASASLRFFDDRLIFTGGITDLRNQRLSDLNVFSDRVATDTELLYLIRKDGRLILRGSNRLNTRHFLLNPSDEYISALGLIYRQEFDSFGEFFRRILLFDRRRTPN